MGISHKQERLLRRGRCRASRPKTFSSKDSAEIWAKNNKLSNFKVEAVRYGLSSKFRVIEE